MPISILMVVDFPAPFRACWMIQRYDQRKWASGAAAPGGRLRGVDVVMDRRRRRRAWFNDGVHAIACVVSPRPPEAYVCPLCLEFFTREQLDAGEVTDEHVPPKAVGGQPLVLTCRACNGASSGVLDEALADEEKLRTFGEAHALGALPGSVTIDGIRSNGSVRFDGQTFKMQVAPAQNNPATTAAHEASLAGLAGGSSIELRLRVKAEPKRARIGWMRSAYLAAFAVYGYRYVLQPAFGPLRAAIADPDATTFEPVVLQAPGQDTLDPLIAEAAAPAALAGSRAVLFGPRLILLPPWLAPENWFATLQQHLTDTAPENLTLVSVIGQRFPDYPLHLTDG
jgi:hypothetical protein